MKKKSLKKKSLKKKSLKKKSLKNKSLKKKSLKKKRKTIRMTLSHLKILEVDVLMVPAHRPPPPPHDLPQPAHQRHISQPTFQGQAYDAHQSYYENGSERRGSRAPTPSLPRGGSPAPAPARPVGKPALSPHGLLHAGIIEKEERSARAQEFQARDTGGPLVSLPPKPSPPQTGLVGAITYREREKERTGGVGRALTSSSSESSPSTSSTDSRAASTVSMEAYFSKNAT